MPSSTLRVRLRSIFAIIAAQLSSTDSGAVTITEFASMNGAAMSPTNEHLFVTTRPRHVRLKLSATSVAEAYVSSNMRDFTPSVFSAAAEKQNRPERSSTNRTTIFIFIA